MPTTPNGIWTPDDNDDWDLTVDLAAMAVSIDGALDSKPENYLIGTNAERLAVTDLFEGLMFYTTDTNATWRHNGSTWGLFNQGPFAATQTFNGGTGTVVGSGVFAPLSGISVTQAITTGVACRAKVTISFQGYVNANGSFFIVGAGATGATTLTPSETGVGSIRYSGVSASPQALNLTGSQIVDLSPGTTTFSVLGLAGGVGSTRTIRYITLIIEPVA